MKKEKKKDSAEQRPKRADTNYHTYNIRGGKSKSYTTIEKEGENQSSGHSKGAHDQWGSVSLPKSKA